MSSIKARNKLTREERKKSGLLCTNKAPTYIHKNTPHTTEYTTHESLIPLALLPTLASPCTLVPTTWDAKIHRTGGHNYTTFGETLQSAGVKTPVPPYINSTRAKRQRRSGASAHEAHQNSRRERGNTPHGFIRVTQGEGGYHQPLLDGATESRSHRHLSAPSSQVCIVDRAGGLTTPHVILPSPMYVDTPVGSLFDCPTCRRTVCNLVRGHSLGGGPRRAEEATWEEGEEEEGELIKKWHVDLIDACRGA